MTPTEAFLTAVRDALQTQFGANAPKVIFGGSDGAERAPYVVVWWLGTGSYEPDRFSSAGDKSTQTWSVVSAGQSAEIAMVIDQAIQSRIAPPVGSGRAITLQAEGAYFTPLEVIDRGPLGRESGAEPSTWTATTVYGTVARYL